MFTIEKNIPLPAIERPALAGRTSKYPWAQMQVGDSFFVKESTVKKFGGTAYSASKRTGHKFAVRSVDGGVRVWRTK